jgi:hypothetical protein
MGGELEDGRGRFNTRPAVAIGIGEMQDPSPKAEPALREAGLDWLFEAEQSSLGAQRLLTVALGVVLRLGSPSCNGWATRSPTGL